MHVPSRTYSTKYDKPWINNRVKNVIRKRKRAYQTLKKYNQPQNLNRYKDLRKEVHKLSKDARNNYLSNELNNVSCSRKKLWKHVKHIKKSDSGIAPLKDDATENIITNPKIIADKFNDQFKAVFTNEDKENIPTVDNNANRPTHYY